MRDALQRLVASAAGLGLVVGGVVAGALPASGDDGGGACAWASVGVLSGPTSTVKVETGSACPALPPSPADPCPGGEGLYRGGSLGMASFEALLCVRDLT